MKKIMASVAPVAATDILNNPRAIAKEVMACYQAGASMVHLHCRDLNGQLTADLSLLAETVDMIRALCPIVIEISTGGVSDLTIEERCQPCLPDWVECNSLNVGSVNLGDAVYQNPIKDVRYCVGQIIQNQKIPEVEVFEVGMINTVRELAQQFAFVRPILFSMVLGHKGAMPATVAALNTMLEGLRDNFPNPEDTLWGITEAHRTDWELIKAALDKGARTVRIGFEDSDYVNPHTRVEDNALLVAEVCDVIKSRGLVPATPDEVRAMLRIPPRRAGR